MAFTLSLPKNRELTGGDLLAQSLKTAGIEVAFGIHGGHLDAFLLGAREAGIRLIDTRHETVAVQAAEGYAKAKGCIGVCFVTANSGYANALPGLASALADRSPIFCITSSAPLRDAESNCLQGYHDQVVVAKPLTKFATRVTEPEQIPRMVAHALRASVAGAPGPTLIDFPIEVLFMPVRINQIAWGSIGKPMPSQPSPAPSALAECLVMLKEAQRPVMIVGTPAGTCKESILINFVETFQIPTCYVEHSGTLPWTHELHAGPASLLGTLPPDLKPDLIFLLGARTGMFLGNRSGRVLPLEKCKYIQCDADGAEIGRSHPIDLGITSESELCLQGLTESQERSNYKVKGNRDWIKVVTALKTAPSLFRDAEKTVRGAMHPYHALNRVMSALPAHSVVVVDGGEASLWAAANLVHARPSLVMAATGYLGFLGNSFGYALGCALAFPARQIVVIIGDGSFGFHAAELDTYARLGLKIATVVVNNSCWGMSKNGQDALYDGVNTERVVSALSAGAAYEQLARGLQNNAIKVTQLSDIEPAVQNLFQQPQPSLINLIVSDKPAHPGTVAMVNRTSDRNVIVVPYYDNIPRAFYKD